MLPYWFWVILLSQDLNSTQGITLQWFQFRWPFQSVVHKSESERRAMVGALGASLLHSVAPPHHACSEFMAWHSSQNDALEMGATGFGARVKAGWGIEWTMIVIWLKGSTSPLSLEKVTYHPIPWPQRLPVLCKRDKGGYPLPLPGQSMFKTPLCLGKSLCNHPNAHPKGPLKLWLWMTLTCPGATGSSCILSFHLFLEPIIHLCRAAFEMREHLHY